MATCYIVMLFLSLILIHIDSNTDDKILVTIFAITNTQESLGNDGVQNTGGAWLAIQEINNNTDFLPGYVFELIVLDAKTDPQEALKKALDVTEYKSNSSHIYFPLIIGAPWSSLCTSIAPILGVKHMGSISSGATSVVLSNTKKYPYFYRTIPTDELQINGTLELCKKFGWSKIAVVYVNDAYGSYFSLGIQERKEYYNIDVTSIAISNDEPETYQHAAEHIIKLNIYVIVIVSHSDPKLFDTFKNERILGYPYYYIGTDGWFNTPTIDRWKINFTNANLTDLQGFIGPIPWRPDSVPHLNEYPQEMRFVVNESRNKFNKILELWRLEEKKETKNNSNLHTQWNKTLSTMIYNYDAMYVIANIIEEIEYNYNVSLIDLLLQDDDELIYIINNITKELDFIGASGNVNFNEHGDRKNGLYSIGNTLEDGTVVYIGYFYYDAKDGKIKYWMDEDKIIWPNWNGKKPRLDVKLLPQIIKIAPTVSISIFVCLCISLYIAFIFMILTCMLHKTMIIRHGSWKLNVIMCVGAILLYIGTGLYGIDETYIFDQQRIDDINMLTILCNLRLWIMVISYTLLFMPFFLKTYRLSVIFKTVLEKKKFEDKKLFIYTIICIIIDITVLTLFTLFVGLKRDYSVFVEWDWIGSCSFARKYTLNWLLYGIIAIWKVCQLLFGIYVGLDVSRIQDITNLLRRYDETGMQLLSILFTCFIICISIAIFIFGSNDIEDPSNKPNFDYLVISISILLIANIVLFFNLFPRIFAVITKKENNFTSPQKRMEQEVKKQLERYHALPPNGNNSKIALSELVSDTQSPLNDTRNKPITPETPYTEDEEVHIQHLGIDNLEDKSHKT